uniref:KH-like RNA-binding domain-containing protein n=1 Tax=Myotis lucifugus TaxID=59463 RepID=G1QCH1_MYOLU
MVHQPGAVVQEDPWMSAQALDRLLKMPLPLPQIRTRPWWFPALELRDPLVFYLEACLADPIFSKYGAMIPETEWMNQVLLTVEKVNSGSLIEITVFGQLHVQNRVKSVLLSLAARHRENRAQDKKMKQLDKFLKAHGTSPDSPVSPVS